MPSPGKPASDGKLRFARSQDAQGTIRFVPRAVDELKSQRLKKAAAVWQSKRPAGAQLPAACDFDILDYRVVMGNLNFIAVLYEPLDFVFRVHSATGAKYVGKDLTGRSVDDYPEPQYREFVRSVFTQATRKREPQVVIEDMFMTDNRLMRWEGIVMPLQDNDGHVTRLIVAFELLR